MVAQTRFAVEKEEHLNSVPKIKQALATKYDLNHFSVNISAVQLSEEFKLVTDGREFAMSFRAFRGLLGLLNIPPRFAMAIPEDLLEFIIRRLREVNPQEVRLFNQEDTVYSMTRADYHPPDLGAIMDVVSDDRQIEMGRVGTEGIRIATLGGVRTEAEVGDAIRVGTYIRASHTGRPFPHASLMTYRLVCSNGAVTGKSWGEVAWPRQNGDSLEIFTNGLTDLMSREELLLPSITSLTDRHLSDFEFARVWRGAKKVVGVESADRLLDSITENRRAILASVAAKQRTGEDPVALTDFSAYDVFNSVSQAANKLPGESAERLMRVAGVLLPISGS